MTPALRIPGLLFLATGALACGQDADGRGVTSRAEAERGAWEASAARLLCARPRQDFGQVWEGARLEHRFEFEVRGEEPLVVQKVRSDCGCTVASLQAIQGDQVRPVEEGDPIAPGTRLVMPVTYNTQDKAGSSLREIQIFGNLPGGMTSVTLEAEVRPWLQAKVDGTLLDRPLSAGRIDVREAGQVQFDVEGVGDRAFQLRATGEGVPPAVQVRLSPRRADGEGRSRAWSVEVVLGPGLPEGQRTYPIYLVTDRVNPDDAAGDFFRLSPHVHVEVVGPVAVSPAIHNFGALDGESLTSRTFRLTGYDPSFTLAEPRVSLLEMTSDEPSPLARTATITSRPIPSLNAWDVEVLFDGLAPEVQGRVLARLMIETGHPEKPRIDAKITGFRLGPPGDDAAIQRPLGDRSPGPR